MSYPDELKRATIELDAAGINTVSGLVFNAFHCFYYRGDALYMDAVNQSPDLRYYRVVGRHEPLVIARGVKRDLDAVVTDLIAALKRNTAFDLLAFGVCNARNRGGLELDLIHEMGWLYES